MTSLFKWCHQVSRETMRAQNQHCQYTRTMIGCMYAWMVAQSKIAIGGKGKLLIIAKSINQIDITLTTFANTICTKSI